MITIYQLHFGQFVTLKHNGVAWQVWDTNPNTNSITLKSKKGATRTVSFDRAYSVGGMAVDIVEIELSQEDIKLLNEIKRDGRILFMALHNNTRRQCKRLWKAGHLRVGVKSYSYFIDVKCRGI